MVLARSITLSGRPASRAHWVEFGTKPHVIRPKSGGGLLSIWAGRPGAIVARVAEVNHPGQKPRAFMRPAFETTAAQVLGAIAGAMRIRLAEAAARAARRSAKAAARRVL